MEEEEKKSVKRNWKQYTAHIVLYMVWIKSNLVGAGQNMVKLTKTEKKQTSPVLDLNLTNFLGLFTVLRLNSSFKADSKT